MVTPPLRSREPWHACDCEEVARGLGVTPREGLCSDAARRLLASCGPNRLAEHPPPARWRLFLDQFRGVLILILIAASAGAALVGDLKDAVVILAVVGLNAVLGFVQELRAGRAMEALRAMLAPRACLRRDGETLEVPAQEIVPGDVVLLDAGDRVPADGRLVFASRLEIDESPLTGESLPAGKLAETTLDPATPLPDRRNMAYMNTSVTRGRGEMVVTATGMNTEMGRLAALLAEAEPEPTPLERNLDRVGRRLAVVAVTVIAGILALELLRGGDLAQAMLTAIALAVAAIPEGLPAVVTVTLALGMWRMARSRAIVKRLASVETLGCTTVICADKTGTLTRNRQTVRRVWYRGRELPVEAAEGGRVAIAEGASLAPLLLPLALCNESRLRDGEVIGDPTEGALLALAAAGGIERDPTEARLRRLAEIPFDSSQRFMATFHFDGDTVRVFVKGGLDALLPRARAVLGPSGEAPLDSTARDAWLARNEALASDALRVIAVATRTIPASEFDPSADLFAYAHELVLVGLVGLLDPPRPEARDAIALCRRAGIEVKMITGDHRRTAAAIAQELGLAGGVLSGAELDALGDEALAARLPEVAVFARVTPEHKVRIVRALRALGHVVAMTGDGVNDAPALRSADIGVAMGRSGTEVTREAAALVLTDDNFATIVGAVREGRTIYDNIGKFVRFQLSTNFGAILSVFAAPILGLPLPFHPVQLLWVNIIMDGPPAMALGTDPARPDIMDRPPRSPRTPILSKPRLARLLLLGTVMAAGTLAVLGYTLRQNTLEHARTLAFTTFVVFQFLNVFNVRSEEHTAFARYNLTNLHLCVALGGVVALQLAATNWDLAQRAFDTVELSAGDGLVAVAVASSIVGVEEIRKLLLRRAGRDSGRARTRGGPPPAPRPPS